MVRFVDSGEGEPGAESENSDGAGLAPVIPLFGGAATRERASRARGAGWHTTWDDDRDQDERPGGGDAVTRTTFFERGDAGEGAHGERSRPAPPTGPDAAERALLKKLRGRSLSVREAEDALRPFELTPADADRIIESMLGYGYLDDAALADQLVHAGVDRKGQGRQVIGRTLAQRGIPREVADAALSALPDDDAERALEFARTKARSMASLDRDAALRRLTGQLARRGYGGSVAMTAARTALDEIGGSRSGVRFR